MIRAADLNLTSVDTKPADQPAAVPVWKRVAIHLDSWGTVLSYASKGCSLAGKVATLAPLHTLTGPLGQAVESLGRIVQVANFVLSAEAFSILNREGEIGLDLSSIREVLIFSGKGADLVTWLTAIEQLGTSLKVINSLTSVGLGLALLSPTISLIIQLRTEGRDALSGLEFYKTAGRLGMTLLTIYLFSSAMTLSALAEALLAGTDWAIS